MKILDRFMLFLIYWYSTSIWVKGKGESLSEEYMFFIVIVGLDYLAYLILKAVVDWINE